MSAFIIAFTTLVAILYPKAGSLVAILSSAFCFFIVYCIPPITHMTQLWNYRTIYSKIQMDIPQIIIENAYDTPDQSRRERFLDNSNKKINSSFGAKSSLSLTPNSLIGSYSQIPQNQEKISRVKLISFFIIDMSVIIFGLSVIILQYIKF